MSKRKIVVRTQIRHHNHVPTVWVSVFTRGTNSQTGVNYLLDDNEGFVVPLLAVVLAGDEDLRSSVQVQLVHETAREAAARVRAQVRDLVRELVARAREWNASRPVLS